MKAALLGCLLTASSAMMFGCHSDRSAPDAGTQTIHARLVESQQQQVPLQLIATGTIHARETALLSAQVMGRIENVLVHEGDLVHAGQILVTLDDSALRASLEQTHADRAATENAQAAAQANSALAASTLERYKQLESQRSVTLQEMDEVSRRANAAEATLNALRAQADAARARERGAQTTLGYTRLAAPFSAIVVARMADPGTLASPGVPLLQLDKAGSLQLNVTVDESSIGSIHPGMTTTVTAASGPTTQMVGTVSTILPAADPASHTFLVKIDLPSSHQLHVGTYGSAAFANGVKLTILVPRSSLVSRGSLTCVYALNHQGIAQLRYITVGMQQGNFVEVLSGLSSGEKLVDAPSDRDLSGKRIEVMP